MKLPNKAKEIKNTETKKIGSTLLDLLNKWMFNMLGCKGVPNRLLVKVIREPFYHSCFPNKLC
jgi:hypothetical protein